MSNDLELRLFPVRRWNTLFASRCASGCSFSCFCLPSSLHRFLFFISHLNQNCILIFPGGSVSHSSSFPFNTFLLFPSHLKNVHVTVVRIFISKWSVEAKPRGLSLLSVRCVCLALLYNSLYLCYHCIWKQL